MKFAKVIPLISIYKFQFTFYFMVLVFGNTYHIAMRKSWLRFFSYYLALKYLHRTFWSGPCSSEFLRHRLIH